MVEHRPGRIRERTERWRGPDDGQKTGCARIGSTSSGLGSPFWRRLLWKISFSGNAPTPRGSEHLQLAHPPPEGGAAHAEEPGGLAPMVAALLESRFDLPDRGTVDPAP